MKKKLKGEVAAAAFCDSDFEDDVVFCSFEDRCSFVGVSFVEFPGVCFFTLFSLCDVLAGVCWNYKQIMFVKAMFALFHVFSFVVP